MLAWPPEQTPELWLWQDSTDAEIDVPLDSNAFAIVKNKLVQRIGNTSHVAILPYKGPIPRLPDTEREVVIDDLWPEVGVPVDMRAAFPPGVLAQRYDEAVWGTSPIALFAKQVLAKARAVLTPDMYNNELRSLLVAPDQVEQRYFHDTEVEKRAQAHRGELVPVSQVLRQLRHRETQLQVVLGLELLPEDQDIEPVLDHHFDRLCIWQAVGGGTDTLSEFCSAVVLPYYKSRCPHKTKQFIQRSRGTLKSRGRKTKKDIAAPSAPLPTGGGLLKALQITGSNPATKSLPESPTVDPKPAPSLRPSAAIRSASHPLYTMASRQNTVEVRFKRSRKHAQMQVSSGSASPTMPAASSAAPASKTFSSMSANINPLTDTGINTTTSSPSIGLSNTSPMPPQQTPVNIPKSPPLMPTQVIPALPDSAENKVQATPRKERSKFLESLNQPLPIDFDAVESTDSDE